MKIILLSCLIGFVAGAAIVSTPEASILPGIYGISDDEKVCIENYLNKEELSLDCDGSLQNVVERLIERFSEQKMLSKCVRKLLSDYKYKDVYLQYEYNAKTHGKTHELTQMAQAAFDGAKEICRDDDLHFPMTVIFVYEEQNTSLAQAQCAYRYSIEKGLLKESDYDIKVKDFDSVDCKSFYEEWRAKPQRHYQVDISDEAHRSEFSKCVHNRPSLIDHDSEIFALKSVARIKGWHNDKLRRDFVMSTFIKERSGLECIRDLASAVVARS